MKIISAVTTSPRPDGVDYLPDTLKSLNNAGFDDPLVVVDDDFRGSWPMLRTALGLLMTDREADCLIVFQDDILVSRGLLGWLEKTLWPSDPATIGCVSLYTAGANGQLEQGWYTSDDLPVFRPWGACGLCFPRRSVRLLLTNPPNTALMTQSDASIATFCRMNGMKLYMHSPSFIQHVGAVGSLGVGDNRGLIPERCAAWFCEDVKELQ